MRHFETYNEMQAALDAGTFRFSPDFGPATIRCSVCRERVPINTGGKSIATGYASTQDNNLVCYPCADAAQRDSLITGRDGPIYAYVDGAAAHVTTWSGGILGTIIGYGEAPAGWHGATIAYFRVRDVHGQWWSGRGGGRGIACTLRPMQSPT